MVSHTEASQLQNVVYKTNRSKVKNVAYFAKI